MNGMLSTVSKCRVWQVARLWLVLRSLSFGIFLMLARGVSQAEEVKPVMMTYEVELHLDAHTSYTVTVAGVTHGGVSGGGIPGGGYAIVKIAGTVEMVPGVEYSVSATGKPFYTDVAFGKENWGHQCRPMYIKGRMYQALDAEVFNPTYRLPDESLGDDGHGNAVGPWKVVYGT